MSKKIKLEPVRYTPSLLEGLTNKQVEERINDKLVNKPVKTKDSILKIILKNIITFFNIMYIVIFVLMVIAQVPISNFLFVIVVLFNLLIGTIQEIKSKIMIDKLSLLSAKKITVIRDSIAVEIPSEKIVLDDIFMIKAGDEVVTDAILMSGEIEVSEAQLTGESVSIRKSIGEMIYSGSVVVSGNGILQAERVGADNEIQKLSLQAKKFSKPKSEIFNSLNYLLRFIAAIIIPLGLIIYQMNYRNLSPLLTDFEKYQMAVEKTSGALLGMIPSGLYLLTSMSLAVSVIKLGKKNTLVHNIYCIEMLARTDVLCLDKTGTITDGTMKVLSVVEKCKHNEYDVEAIVASMNKSLNEQNFTSKALLEYFGESNKYKPVSILPFNSTNKYSAVTFENGTFVLGAPEFVLKTGYSKYEEEINDYANRGLRVLALGITSEIKNDKIAKAAKLLALILIEDQIRPDAVETINYFKENGVGIRIISGDNPFTVSEVAKRVGVENAEMAISLDGLSDEEVKEAALKYTVFGRVNPEQKKLIVQTLKKQKHTVAMTGDGVNDILALKEADCSIAMASGCEAVKNVSHLVLLDSNFSSMPSIVNEGRRVINNVQQTSMLYIVKTLFIIILSILFVTGFISAFGPEGGNNTFPISPSQLTLIEIFAIGIPAFYLSLQPNYKQIKGHFVFNVLQRSLPGALAVALEIVLTYVFSSKLGLSNMEVISIVVIVATTTCMMVLYVACKPFTIKKFIMYVVMAASCITITLLSMNGKSIKNFNFQSQFKIFNLSKEYNNKPVTVELEELPGSLMTLTPHTYNTDGVEYNVYTITYDKPKNLSKIVENSTDGRGVLVLFGNGSLNTAYSVPVDINGSENFFIPRINEEDKTITFEAIDYFGDFIGSTDDSKVTIYFVNNQEWDDTHIYSLLHYEKKTNVLDATSLLLAVALSEASYIILVAFNYFINIITDKKEAKRIRNRLHEMNDFNIIKK